MSNAREPAATKSSAPQTSTPTPSAQPSQTRALTRGKSYPDQVAALTPDASGPQERPGIGVGAVARGDQATPPMFARGPKGGGAGPKAELPKLRDGTPCDQDCVYRMEDDGAQAKRAAETSIEISLHAAVGDLEQALDDAEKKFAIVEELMETTLELDTAIDVAEYRSEKAIEAHDKSQQPSFVDALGFVIDFAGGLKGLAAAATKTRAAIGAVATTTKADKVMTAVDWVTAGKLTLTSGAKVAKTTATPPPTLASAMVSAVGEVVRLSERKIDVTGAAVIELALIDTHSALRLAARRGFTAVHFAAALSPEAQGYTRILSGAVARIEAIDPATTDLETRAKRLQALNRVHKAGNAAGLDKGSARRGLFDRIVADGALRAKTQVVIQLRLEVRHGHESEEPTGYALVMPTSHETDDVGVDMLPPEAQPELRNKHLFDHGAEINESFARALMSTGVATQRRAPKTAYVEGSASHREMPIEVYRADPEAARREADTPARPPGSMIRE